MSSSNKVNAGMTGDRASSNSGAQRERSMTRPLSTTDLMTTSYLIPGSVAHVAVVDFIVFLEANHKPGMDVAPLVKEFRFAYHRAGESVWLPWAINSAADARSGQEKKRLTAIFDFWTHNCETCGESWEQARWLTRKGQRVGRRFRCASGHRKDEFSG